MSECVGTCNPRMCPDCFKSEVIRLLPGAVRFEKNAEGRDIPIVGTLEACREAFLRSTGYDIALGVDGDSESSEH